MNLNNNKRSNKTYDLNHVILKLSKNPRDHLTVRDFLRGFQSLGATGAGKTSSTGRKIAKEFLKFGMGGIIHCSKPSERKEWEDLVEFLYKTGEVDRRADLVIFSEDSPYRFNPLGYERERGGKGSGETFTIVTLLMNIYQMSNNLSGGSSGKSERFWDNSLKRLMKRMVALLMLSEEEVSIANMHAIVSSLLSKEEAAYLQELLSNFAAKKEKLAKWGNSNYYIKCFLKATLNVLKLSESGDESKEREYFIVKNYFNRELIAIHERTRTIITESFLGIVEPFLTGVLYKHFVQDTTIYPEWTHQGKIIILDFPVKDYLELGVLAQGIFRYMWQQSTERRNFVSGYDVPVFLWADEAQLFLSDYESVFQSTARSAGVATVYLSQNISGYYSINWGGNAKAKVDALLGNLSIKFYHANQDPVTNELAARTIGKQFRKMISYGMNSHSGSNSGLNEQLHYQVEPTEFTMLRTGGPENDFLVDIILTVTGKQWSNNKNFLRKTFKQLFV